MRSRQRLKEARSRNRAVGGNIHTSDTFGAIDRAGCEGQAGNRMTLRRQTGLALLGLVATAGVALAQTWQQPQGYPPPAQAGPPGQIPPRSAYQNQICTRLEAQLAHLDRGGGMDPAQAEQIRKYEANTSQQQAEIDRTVAQARRLGCSSSGFFLFSLGQNPQCTGLNNQIDRMRANLARLTSEMQRLQGGSLDRGEQRRSILMSLGENNCGPQYRSAQQQAPGFFGALFGGTPDNPSYGAQGGTYRTLCVRTCDGSYFPVSFATVPARFQEDEQACRRMCPAAEVMLFTHRNPGEEVAQAVSITGQPYTALPNAFRFRQEFNASCSCRRPGQSWAEAVGPDQSLEQGDVVVTEDRARQMSRPREPAKQKGAAHPPAQPAPASQPAPAAQPAPSAEGGKRSIRSVGPPFIPAR